MIKAQIFYALYLYDERDFAISTEIKNLFYGVEYEAILETLEILSDANLMANLRQGITEAKSEQGVDWESAKRELDL